MNTYTVALTRRSVSPALVLFALLGLFMVASVAHAASTDYYLKIDGVDGESTKAAEETRGTEPGTSVTGSTKPEEVSADYYLKLDGVEGESKPTPGVEPDEIDYDGKQETNFGVLLDSGGSDDDGDGVDDSESRKGNVEYGWKVEGGERVSIEARELRGLGEQEKAEFLSEVKAFAELQSEQDLENFARGILLENDELIAVQFNPKELSVSRKASGKLFGFIPVTYKEEVRASGDDGAEVEIEVKLPWWSFLISPDVDPEELAQEAKKKHKETIEIDSWSWGASNAGSLLKAISDVLKTKHDTVKNSVSNVR